MKTLCWTRRDLRLSDHVALSTALSAGETTLLFVFDQHILEKLKSKSDRRITFIIQSLKEMELELQKHGSSLLIRYGKPEDIIPQVVKELEINHVYCNSDYEPYAKKRDALVQKNLTAIKIPFTQFKDCVFYEKHEVLKDDGGVYKVFTPYKNKWLEKFHQTSAVPDYKCPLKQLRKFENKENIMAFDWYKQIGFTENLPLLTGGTTLALKRLKQFEKIISDYKHDRDFPSLDGTSQLSVYIRFGNLSIRQMVRAASQLSNEGAKTWLSELIWRDFYQMILDSHPHVEKESFKREYDQIKWLGTEKDFKAWCQGETGFPLVDAAMRCFNQTGMMHNRLRMVVASFLCKILLVNWRKGESYFAVNLLDYDLAANNGGWQWSSSSGCDAQPYFRIFNPYNQSEKFDPDGNFIKTWVPELSHLPPKELHRPEKEKAPDYPRPIVNYETNRRRCLLMYAVVKK